MSDLMADLYLKRILANHSPNLVDVSACKSQLIPYIKAWAGNQLHEVFISGSTSKGTAVKGSSDVDLFISIGPDCTNTLKEIYDSLLTYFSNNGFSPRRQNVSVGLTLNGISIDLTLGKKDPGNTNYHKIYSNRTESWKQTNVKMQINQVAQSQRTQEIKLAKIWRGQQRLDFLSYYLEVAVIDALRGCSAADLSGNFERVLRYFANDLPSRRIMDITNTNNVLSDEVSAQGKSMISSAAAKTLRVTTWQGRIS